MVIRIISLDLPEEYLQRINKLIDEKKTYLSLCDAIRKAIRDLLVLELQEFKTTEQPIIPHSKTRTFHSTAPKNGI